MSAFESAFEIKNTGDSSVQFILEPWGNEIAVSPGSTVRVGFRSHDLKTIPITHKNGCIVVEGWEGVEATGIWLDGELVG
jgi:hypothetical protein